MDLQINNVKYTAELNGEDLLLMGPDHDLLFENAAQLMWRDGEKFFDENFISKSYHTRADVDCMREVYAQEWVDSDFNRSCFIEKELKHFKRIEHE